MPVLDSLFASQVVLVATAAVVLYAAVTDFRTFTISNNLIVALALLFVLYASISGRWSEVPWNIGFATLILVFLIWFYALGWMGGGDVKLLTVALLWTGLHCALVFAILLLVLSCLHTAVVKIKGAATQKSNGGAQTRIPFAPSIAAALVGVIMLGCLRVPA